jgi:hypothetical protein
MNEVLKRLKIKQQNDLARRRLACRTVMTCGIAALSPDDQLNIVNQVRNFDQFNQDNDPHGEHDFGSFKYGKEKIFWKFDYYDKSLEYGSEDPSDPAQTTRVLTTMFAHEY